MLEFLVESTKKGNFAPDWIVLKKCSNSLIRYFINSYLENQKKRGYIWLGKKHWWLLLASIREYLVNLMFSIMSFLLSVFRHNYEVVWVLFLFLSIQSQCFCLMLVFCAVLYSIGEHHDLIVSSRPSLVYQEMHFPFPARKMVLEVGKECDKEQINIVIYTGISV